MDSNEQLSELDERLRRGEIRLPEYFKLRSQLLPDPSMADSSTTYPRYPVTNQAAQADPWVQKTSGPPPNLQDAWLAPSGPQHSGQQQSRQQQSQQQKPSVADPSPWTQPRVAAGKSLTRKRRRNASVVMAAAVLLVLALLGAGFWLVHSQGKQASAPPPLAASTQPVPKVEQPIFDLANSKAVPELTGASSPAQAQRNTLLYPYEAQALGRCGATTGKSQVLQLAGWRITSTMFGCRDDSSAGDVLSQMAIYDRATLKFERIDYPDGRIHVVRNPAVSSAGNPAGVAAEYHVRYRSKVSVVDLIIQAKDEATAKSGLNESLKAVTGRYQPS